MWRFFYVPAPISRILYPSIALGTMAIYLAPQLLTGSSGTPLDFSRGTALHTSKGLAVSLPPHRRDSPRREPYPFGIRRLCSHLADCSGRVLPATTASSLWIFRLTPPRGFALLITKRHRRPLFVVLPLQISKKSWPCVRTFLIPPRRDATIWCEDWVIVTRQDALDKYAKLIQTKFFPLEEVWISTIQLQWKTVHAILGWQ